MTGVSLWEAVCSARATLAPHAHVHRRQVRGEDWAVLHNALNGEQVRLNEAALSIVLALDGERRVAEVLETRQPSADGAFRETLAEALLTLESAGLIRLGRAGDTARLVDRARRRRRRRTLDPLALRVPLHDPDAWLSRFVPHLSRLRARTLCLALSALFAAALAVGIGAGERLANELAEVATRPERWWVYVLVWPLLKLVHELAHAVLVKRFGGAVHEAGITLLVLMPVPYVDASDSARFERRRARIAVAAAGMLAECALAAFALLLWSVTEPGLVHEAALAAAVLGSVSTLLFNANPLLRFDGYQILQDALDMPNLGTRAAAYLSWSLRRTALRAAVPRPPLTGPRERRWLLGYALASLLYRSVLTLTIALFLAASVPLLGVPLALFALYRFAVRPALRAVRYLHGSTELAGHRHGAVLAAAACVVLPCAAIALVPLPSSTRVEGVVTIPPETALVAPAGGFVAEVSAVPGAHVRPGERVIALRSPELAGRRARLDAEAAVLETRRHALLGHEPGEAARLDARLDAVRGESSLLAADLRGLTMHAPAAGRFAPDPSRIVPGRGVTRGELLGHIANGARASVEVVVEQRAIGRLRDGVRAVRVRLAERIGEAVPARVVGGAPAADRRLPSAALAFDGTRGIAVASDAGELRTVEPVFHLELELPAGTALSGVGGRAYVTLVHDAEPLGHRLGRAVRQLFLEKLSF